MTKNNNLVNSFKLILTPLNQHYFLQTHPPYPSTRKTLWRPQFVSNTNDGSKHSKKKSYRRAQMNVGSAIYTSAERGYTGRYTLQVGIRVGYGVELQRKTRGVYQ